MPARGGEGAIIVVVTTTTTRSSSSSSSIMHARDVRQQHGCHAQRVARDVVAVVLGLRLRGSRRHLQDTPTRTISSGGGGGGGGGGGSSSSSSAWIAARALTLRHHRKSRPLLTTTATTPEQNALRKTSYADKNCDRLRM